MNKDDKDVPSWKLERIALGEIPKAGGKAEGDALAEIDASNQSILEVMPTADVVREVERRRRLQHASPVSRSRTSLYVGLGMALATAAALVVVLRSDTKNNEQVAVGLPYSNHGLSTERVKGDERLLVQIQHSGGAIGGAIDLADESEVSPHDLLQLSYIAAGRRYGVVISIDGRKAVTPHLPERGTDAVALSQSGRTSLPSSYELDDAPDFERFYLVTSQTPFDLRSVLQAAEALSVEKTLLVLPAGLQQTIFTVQKVQP